MLTLEDILGDDIGIGGGLVSDGADAHNIAAGGLSGERGGGAREELGAGDAADGGHSSSHG